MNNETGLNAYCAEIIDNDNGVNPLDIDALAEIRSSLIKALIDKNIEELKLYKKELVELYRILTEREDAGSKQLRFMQLLEINSYIELIDMGLNRKSGEYPPDYLEKISGKIWEIIGSRHESINFRMATEEIQEVIAYLVKAVMDNKKKTLLNAHRALTGPSFKLLYKMKEEQDLFSSDSLAQMFMPLVVSMGVVRGAHEILDNIKPQSIAKSLSVEELNLLKLLVENNGTLMVRDIENQNLQEFLRVCSMFERKGLIIRTQAGNTNIISFGIFPNAHKVLSAAKQTSV